MGRARFMFYPWFIFFNFFFVGDQTQISTRPTLNYAICNVYSPEAVKTLIHGQFYGYYFLCCGSNIFSFGFIKVWDSKGNNKYAKEVLHQPWKCVDVAAFTFTTWKIRSCLLCKFISPEATVINLFAILRVFLVVLGKWSKFFGCFIAASS